MSITERVSERIPKKNDVESTTLKDCPFCGSNDVRLSEASNILQTGAKVSCQNCGCGTMTVYTNTLAVGLWNRRAEGGVKSQKETDTK